MRGRRARAGRGDRSHALVLGRVGSARRVGSAARMQRPRRGTNRGRGRGRSQHGCHRRGFAAGSSRHDTRRDGVGHGLKARPKRQVRQSVCPLPPRLYRSSRTHLGGAGRVQWRPSRLFRDEVPRSIGVRAAGWQPGKQFAGKTATKEKKEEKTNRGANVVRASKTRYDGGRGALLPSAPRPTPPNPTHAPPKKRQRKRKR